MTTLLDLTRLGYAEGYDGPWLPPLTPTQCRFMEVKPSKKLKGSFMWWCDREAHALGDHHLNCRTL